VLRILPPCPPDLGKRLTKSPKVYVRYTGVLHSLLGIASTNELLGHPGPGPSRAGMVIETVIQCVPDWNATFYRTSDGTERDLVFERANRRLAVECKASTAPRANRGTANAMADLQVEHAWIVAPVDARYPVSCQITTSRCAAPRLAASAPAVRSGPSSLSGNVMRGIAQPRGIDRAIRRVGATGASPSAWHTTTGCLRIPQSTVFGLPMVTGRPAGRPYIVRSASDRFRWPVSGSRIIRISFPLLTVTSANGSRPMFKRVTRRHDPDVPPLPCGLRTGELGHGLVIAQRRELTPSTRDRVKRLDPRQTVAAASRLPDERTGTTARA